MAIGLFIWTKRGPGKIVEGSDVIERWNLSNQAIDRHDVTAVTRDQCLTAKKATFQITSPNLHVFRYSK